MARKACTAGISRANPRGSSQDGAHVLPSELMAMLYATTGRLPDPVHGAVGTITVVAAATGRSLESLVLNRICVDVTGVNSGPTVTCRVASTDPGGRCS